MQTKRYQDWKALAIKGLRDIDTPGWVTAEATHNAVCYLMEQHGYPKGYALKVWADDINRPRFSKTSARRYFDVWDRYGDVAGRLTFNDEPLSFAEHYAIVRGGRPALDSIYLAKANGRGVYTELARSRASLG